MTKSLAQMQQQVREINEANGWFESDRTFGEDIALLHSEASEMLEAYRERGMDSWGKFSIPVEPVENPEVETIISRFRDVAVEGGQAYNPTTHEKVPDLTEEEIDILAAAGLYKPEGVGSEAADVLIRLLDTCERTGIDLESEFERKTKYNATRGHRHGGKRL